MSDFERSRPARALDAIVAEAREHLDVRSPDADSGEASGDLAARTESRSEALADIDWTRLEARVMAAVEAEKPVLLRDVERRSGRARSRDVALRAGAVLLAAAAAVAVFVRNDRDVALNDVRPGAGESAMASSLREAVGAGEVRVGGIVAPPGYVVRSGDAIEFEGARAVFERPRKVTWLLEQGPGEPVTRARVKSAGEPLILGLEQGVVEAQVVPVPMGEAFAVDIATATHLVRVAVHGTHLRVARAGNRVVVDLTEGVVSIGVPPRTGVTYGTLVTAPAHVELDVTDLATLRVDHEPASVRAAIPLGGHEAAPSFAARPDTSSSPSQAAPPSSPAQPSIAKGTVSRTVVPPSGGPPSVVLAPRDAILAAVRDCAAKRSRSGDVHVTVTSDLRLRVSASGVVESAQFVPPLLPDVQSCAAEVIYKIQLEEAGTVTVPIEFSY